MVERAGWRLELSSFSGRRWILPPENLWGLAPCHSGGCISFNQLEIGHLLRIQLMISLRSTVAASKLLLLRSNYIRQKEIDEICKGYGDGWKDKAKMYTKMFAHIIKEGFIDAKKEASLYWDLKKKPISERTEQDWNDLIRMRHDFYRLGPLVIIQILPMSGPLFILYMYTYPGSIPSWFLIDKFHEKYELGIREVQKNAVQYFKDRNVKPSDINFKNMSLEEARKLGECLYGYYRDGTIGYQKLSKKTVRYIISEEFSKYLIKRKFRYKFNSDLKHQDIFQGMTFDEKVRWKYEQVVVKGELMRPFEETLSPEELAARRGSAEQEVAEQNQGKEDNGREEEKEDSINENRKK